MNKLSLSTLVLYHGVKLLVLCVVVAGLVLLELQVGEIKSFVELDYWDIAGEGAAALLSLLWVYLVLASRINGKVTSLLFSGLSCFFIATFQDFLDEFIRVDQGFYWDGVVESAPAPIGMILISMGLFLWQKEQRTINEQLAKKERFYREHSAIDFVTGLYRADYMHRELERELVLSRRARRPLSVLTLDVDDFSRFNLLYGDQEGDRLLRQISELLVMNLRPGDLACRYAGDRFIVLLPDCNADDAYVIADQIEQSIKSLAYKPTSSISAEYHTVATGLATAATVDSAKGLIDRANRSLDARKSAATALRQEVA